VAQVALDSRFDAVDRSASAYDAFRAVRTFGSLDGLRCLSIIAVIWSHAGRKIAGVFFGSLLMRGGFGVDLFFVISGFLITTLMLRERDANGHVSLRKFYIRRALRIFPLYFAALGLYIAMVAVASRGREQDADFWHNLPYFLTYTYNIKDPFFVHHGIFGHSWSLATEEQFYLMWPMLFVFAPRWLQIAALAGVIGLDVRYSFPSQVLPLDQQPLSIRLLAALSTPICLGVLMALTMHSRRGFAVLWRAIGWKWAGPVFLALMLVSLSIWREGETLGSPRNAMLISTLGGWLAAAGLVGSCVIREDNAMRRVLAWRPIAWVGVVSYGLYLLHPLGLGIAQRVLYKVHLDGSLGVTLTIGTFIVACAMAAISFYFFERPFLRIKKRFETKAQRAASELERAAIDHEEQPLVVTVRAQSPGGIPANAERE
jgi:peptidoglycan/LPS O-acetylase OafA/YrhL